MKKYTEMTPAERLADRIAKNKAADQRIEVAMAPVKARVNRQAAAVGRMAAAFLEVAPKLSDRQVAKSLEVMASAASGLLPKKDLDKMKAYARHLKEVERV